MLTLVTALASAAFVPQQQPTIQRATGTQVCASCSVVPGPASTNARRAALIAGGTVAASMLPIPAWADSIADIAARSNAKAEEDMTNKAAYDKADEDKKVLIVCVIAGVTLLSPLAGIRSATNAISAMDEKYGELDDVKGSLRGNDPKLPWQK